MRRIFACIVCLAVLAGLCACAGEAPESPVSPVSFYYRRGELSYEGGEGVIVPEQREALGHEQDLDWLLAQYFAGPVTEGLTLPFRKGLRPLRCVWSGDTLTLTVSRELSELSGIDLTVACACMAQTLFALTDCTGVTIASQGGEADVSLFVARDGLLLQDDSAQHRLRELQVYFTDTRRRYLTPESRTVDISNPVDAAQTLVQALLDGPQDGSLVCPLPDGTRLLQVSVQSGVCSVSFSGEFSRNVSRDEVAQRTALLSVIDTLTQLDQVDTVEFYEEGNLLVLYGFMDLSTPWTRDESIIGPVRASVNEFDADLCGTIGAQSYLAKVPVKLRRSANETPEELALGALLAWEPGNGYQNPIPKDTKLLSAVTDEAGLCTVSLSPEFLEAPTSEALTLAVHAVVGTLCSLAEVSRVQILVDGRTPQEQSSLFLPQSAHAAWFY